MGLSLEEVETLRKRYPDRLQTMSKLADFDVLKTWYLRAYVAGGIWGMYFGLYPLSEIFIMSRLKKGSHYLSGIPMTAPLNRYRLRKGLFHLVAGFSLCYLGFHMHNEVENKAAAVWAINATHVGDFRPKGQKFLDRHFPEEELSSYATAQNRMKVLRMWKDDNAMTT
eukprot:Sspe_Gene.84147::Locus_55234_Transcript_3_4_Confidence_0.333_Length_689::g.84147::m.84147